MDKEQREIYLRDNYGRVSIGMASKVTGLPKQTIQRKWAALKDSPDFVVPEPLEPKYEGEYVFIPKLRAKVKLRKGQTVESYLAKLGVHGMMVRYSTGAKKADLPWYEQ